MSDVFISHVEEDADIALEITLGLEEAGYTTWCYEVDSIPGPSYLIQTGQAIEQSKAVILVISPHSLGSRQITREVVRASESNKEFIPVRRDITHVEFQNRQPEWRQAVGAAASIGIPRQGVMGVLPRIIDGIKSSGIHPRLKTDAGRIVQIRKAIDELQGRSMLEKTEELPVPTKKSELEYDVAEMPEEKVKPAVSVERPTEAVKVAARPAWSWVGIALLSIALGLLAWGTVDALLGEHTLDFYMIMLLLAAPFMVSGIYCLRRGMAEDLRTMPVEGRIPNWWWLLPVVLAFIGGIISWAKQKDVNWRQAMNMLTLGIILTPIWTIPLVMFPPPVTPPESQPIYADDFSDPNSGWPTKSTEIYEANYEDGEYYILVKKLYDDWVYWEVNSNAGQFTDFVLEIDARLTSGSKLDTKYGLVFRVQDNLDYYGFRVSGNGDYTIHRRRNGVWTDLRDWRRSAFVNVGYSTNHLKIVCQGSQIEVYVNGHYLTTVTDKSFAEGYVGLLVDTSQPNAGAAFDNIRVYSVPVTPSTPPEAPVANFSAIPTSGLAPLSVTFSDESTGDPASWRWDFPGGSPSSASTQGPHTVTYSVAGNYTVDLTVENARGNHTETKTRYIHVIEAPIPAGQLIYEDDFSDLNSGWPLERLENVEWGYQDGKYYMLVKKFDWSAWVENQNAGRFTDFALEIDARLISGPNQNAYGLLFRFQGNDNFYRFLVSGEGYYLVQAMLDGWWTDLQSWTKSAFINEGYSTNHLKVVCKGPQIEVYVNGHHLTNVTDNSFASGYVGMVISMEEPNHYAAFDNIRVYSIG